MTEIDKKIAEGIKEKLLNYKKEFPDTQMVKTGELQKCIAFLETIIISK